MLAVLRWIFAVCLMGSVMFVALLNRSDVTFTFSPLHDPVSIELCWLIVAPLGIGFLAGALFHWVQTLPLYLDHARQRRTLKKIQAQPAAPQAEPVVVPARSIRELTAP